MNQGPDASVEESYACPGSGIVYVELHGYAVNSWNSRGRDVAEFARRRARAGRVPGPGTGWCRRRSTSRRQSEEVELDDLGDRQLAVEVVHADGRPLPAPKSA